VGLVGGRGGGRGAPDPPVRGCVDYLRKAGRSSAKQSECVSYFIALLLVFYCCRLLPEARNRK
jgi:hypothetical protein